MWLDEIVNAANGKLPFAFTYGGKRSRDFLGEWAQTTTVDSARFSEDEKNGGLVVSATVKKFDALPAFDMRVTLENTGTKNTRLVENFSTLAFAVDAPLKDGSYLLHKTLGGLSTPDDFTQSDVVIPEGGEAVLSATGGRSSNKDLPFFRVDTGRGHIIIAVGWTGQWKCAMKNTGGALDVSAGMERSRFIVRPGERLALGSMVALFWEGDPLESNNAFRELLLEHYIPAAKGRGKTPHLFCNTCFTRGGHWLNECDEQNQIRLISALEPLGCENVITDAGWFPGGWPLGAGNWDADPHKYPRGFKPVSDAAKARGMGYGLWFELERVVAGTTLALKHKDWLLRANNPGAGDLAPGEHALLNLGIPEAVDHIYAIVEDKILRDGITCYRQDFNMDPLAHWDANDAPDRVGITEIKYVNGLYGFLDKLRKNHPGLFMDGCSSGGRRLDIEMLKRFHTHQKTDYWFRPEVDQNSLFALAHYLPAVAFTAHVNRYDDYPFNSAAAATLCLGWIADSGEDYQGNGPFALDRARELIERYNTVRPYLNRSFYPLAVTCGAVLAFEFFDRAADSGVVFIFAREGCAADRCVLNIMALRGDSEYVLEDLAMRGKKTLSGKTLQSGLAVDIGKPPFSTVLRVTPA
ncbi:MAG: alpha-galactosidase [Kiritimatiellaeota bacterium]|nr:alpha-galactosidase [Kiritimatiellota bacterium]